LHHKHTNLQILDLPGIIDRAADNRGFGKKVLSVVRACDLVVLVVDSKNPIPEIEMLLGETKKAGIRFNTEKPNISMKRLSSGGIQVPLNNSLENISYDLIKQVLNDMKYINAEVIIHEKNLLVEDFIDSIYGNLVYKKALICLNKIDLFSLEQLEKKLRILERNFLNFHYLGCLQRQI
jgi:ribosome-interacting GTPase 1